ncbi:MAG: hypothetical protein VX438_18035 [Planctomycetota bacterium]|nr:hypothetical protein [Planctomycetota bacterium]
MIAAKTSGETNKKHPVFPDGTSVEPGKRVGAVSAGLLWEEETGWERVNEYTGNQSLAISSRGCLDMMGSVIDTDKLAKLAEIL